MDQAEARRSIPPSYRHMSFRSTLRPCRCEGVKMVVYIYGAQRGNPDMGHVAIPLTRLPSHQYDAATYKFTGKERDAESGLDNFGARYNSSAIGRFTSPDPKQIGAHMLDPQTLNRYAYTRNNPLAYVDPDGRDLAKAWADVKTFASSIYIKVSGGRVEHP